LTLFMWISVMPLYEALASRRGTQALAVQMTSVRDYCSNEEYFKRIGYDPRPPAPAKPPARTLPAWLRPLAGEALRQPMDAAVREVRLVDDGQVAAFAKYVGRFRSLTYVSVLSRGLSAGGVATLRDALPKVSQLVQMHVTCPVPAGLLKSAPKVRCIWINSGARAVNRLGPEEMSDLASLQELRHLDLRHVRINDADLQLLAQSGSLRQIWLRAEGVTLAGIEQLRASMSKCDVKLIAPPNNVILPMPAGQAPLPADR
jgi:hypothetical protein